jgi:hypothetical protein
MIFLVFKISICLDADQDPETHTSADLETVPDPGCAVILEVNFLPFFFLFFQISIFSTL